MKPSPGITGLLRTVALPLAAIVAAFFLAVPAQASPPPDFSGHYELVDAKAARSFSLDVKQKDRRAEAFFSASMIDGSGAAPDARGKGEIEDGVLTFKFKDSFNNEGTCTLEPNKGVFQLNITVTKVVEPSPLHFYGELMMKKTSARPATP
jgi:hypothetical protein